VNVAAPVETLQARTSRLAREMATEQARQALINSTEGVTLARGEAERLFASLDNLASAEEHGLQFKVVKEPRGRAVYLHGFSLTCVWSNSVVNTAQYSRLHVKVWRGNVDFGKVYFADNVRELQSRQFVPDFTSAGQPVWRDEKGRDVLSTEQLMEQCVTMLLEQVEQDSERRP
jgi:hypothetical protein